MYRAFLFLLCFLPLFNTTSASAAPLNVVTSFSILADMAKQVGGDEVQVASLVPTGGDIHAYSPTPGDIERLSKADLILINGLGLEAALERLLQPANIAAKVITVSNAITPIMADNQMPDPHAWQDIRNGKLYATTIRDALARADAAHAEYYRKNTERYLQELTDTEQWVKATLLTIPADKRRAITSHDSLRYFARAYGIDFVAAQGIKEEEDLSAHHVAALIDQMRREHIRVVFLERMGNPQLVQQLAEDGNATVGGELYSDSLSDGYGDATSYTALLRHNVRTIAEALQK